MVYLDNTTEEQLVYIPREGFLAGAHSGGGEKYYPGDNISISPNNVISVTGMTEAISAATSDFVTSGDVHSQIEEETSDFVTSGTVETMISGKADSSALTQVANSVTSLTSSVELLQQDCDTLKLKKADTSAVTEAISAATQDMATETWVNNQGFLTEHQSLSAYSTTNEVESMITAATDGLASETYVDNSVSGKADTSAVTEAIGSATSGLASTQYVDNAVSGKVDTSAMSAYTPTSGFTTINGSAITEGGNMVIQASSDILEEINTLPANPVDGAVYNYNGVLIKYVNGSGNWGYWTGENSVKPYGRDAFGSLTLFYGVLPSDMDGELVFGLGAIKSSSADSSISIWGYLDLQNNVINLYNNKDKTGSTIAVVELNHNEISVYVTYGNCYISWFDNCIQIRPESGSVQVLRYCSTSASTAHYELVKRPDYVYPITRDSFIGSGYSTYDIRNYGCVFENDGTVRPGVPLYKKSQSINGNFYSFAMAQNQAAPNFYAPTASGATGTLLVSQGNAAPQWKTIAQALGIDFWTGTQDEYDAITTKSATTLYIIIPDNS